MSGPKKFQLKAGNHWAIKPYKGKPRVVMNRNFMEIRQPIKPVDVLSVSQVRSLAAWLNRYLNLVAPTEQSVVIAGIRAQSRGIDRNVERLEAAQTNERQD